jgi:hypothetical protein
MASTGLGKSVIASQKRDLPEVDPPDQHRASSDRISDAESDGHEDDCPPPTTRIAFLSVKSIAWLFVIVAAAAAWIAVFWTILSALL